ncbi:hypothetical protein YC2023_011564 [Brassica napus]
MGLIQIFWNPMVHTSICFLSKVSLVRFLESVGKSIILDIMQHKLTYLCSLVTFVLWFVIKCSHGTVEYQEAFGHSFDGSLVLYLAFFTLSTVIYHKQCSKNR